MKIHTHFNVDLDAVASVWAATQFIPGAKGALIVFHPANWNGEGMEDEDIALDIDAGGRGMKGEKGANGVIHSCFASIVARAASTQDQLALANLTAYVDAQDAHGSAVKFLAPEASKGAQNILGAVGINAVLRALQATLSDDALVIDRMSEIFSGMLSAGRARMRAVTEADKAEILPNGKVAIVTDSREFATNGVLFEERGVRAIVYIDGYNLGVIRHGDEPLHMDHEALRAIVSAAGELDEWFAHPAGFLFCRGSRKAPASSKSQVDAWLLAKTLAQLLAK